MDEDMTPMVEKFWVVLRENCQNSGRPKKHATQELAKSEAERLSKKEGATFVWMGVEGAFVQTQPPVVEAILIEKNVARSHEFELDQPPKELPRAEDEEEPMMPF
jgi:hypothetical protein